MLENFKHGIMTLAIGNPGKLPEGRGMFKPHKLYSVGSEGIRGVNSATEI